MNISHIDKTWSINLNQRREGGGWGVENVEIWSRTCSNMNFKWHRLFLQINMFGCVVSMTRHA